MTERDLTPLESFEQDEMTIRYAVERQIRAGCRANIMWLLSEIIDEYALDKFGLHDRFYRKGDAA